MCLDTGLIYIARNKINDKCYIGMTSRKLDIRRRKHISNFAKGRDTHFYRAMEKYGENVFIWRVIEDNIPLIELNDLEMLYIDMFHTYTDGYNSTMGGGGTFGIVASEETRKKLSIAHSGKRNYMYGRKHTEETKEKIRAKKIGVSCSEELKRKRSIRARGEKNPNAKINVDDVREIRRLISLSVPYEKIGEMYGIGINTVSRIRVGKAWKGVVASDEIEDRLRKVSRFVNGRYGMLGKTHTKQARQKLREAKMGTTASAETRAKLSKIRMGEGNSNSKLTTENVILIKKALKLNISCKELGEQYNVGLCAISRIKRGVSWKGVA